MDLLTPSSMRVTVSRISPTGQITAPTTDLNTFVSGSDLRSAEAFHSYTKAVRIDNSKRLKAGLVTNPMGMSESAAARVISKGTAKASIKSEYQEKLAEAIDRLADRYALRVQEINDDTYDNLNTPQQREAQRKIDQEHVLRIYKNLFDAMIGETPPAPASLLGRGDLGVWVRTIITPDTRIAKDNRGDELQNSRDLIRDTVLLSQLYRGACDAQGRGVFATLVSFKMNRLHRAASALLRDQDVSAAVGEIAIWLKAVCWLVRFHTLYAIIITIISLAVWSVIGGAICRIAALQVAREERIGPLRALKFSMAKFADFFSAPLIPMVVIIIIALIMFLLSLIGAIPGVGEIITGAFLGLALFGGFIIALLCIGLIGGVNLMYPTIAVEGSDGFDALSRSFSYVFERPWHMLFYTLLGGVYGVICYFFVRLFAFLMLLAVHTSVGLAVNVDGASLISVRGKLDAMWSRPTFDNLHASINWLGLNGSEAVGALFIWIWVGMIIALVMAFVVSYFFTLNTTIYFLLRRRVDATDIEDVFVEEDMEQLATEAAPTEEDKAQPESPVPGAEEIQTPPQEQTPQEQTPPDNPPDNPDQPEEPPVY